ncbi:MAG: hypothetical protein ABH864_04710 [archaeon]
MKLGLGGLKRLLPGGKGDNKRTSSKRRVVGGDGPPVAREGAYVEAMVSGNYEGGLVKVRFLERYRVVIDTERGYVPKNIRSQLGVQGNPSRIGMGITGLDRVSEAWADRYKVGNGGMLKIPVNVVQRYIANKIGLSSQIVTLGAGQSDAILDVGGGSDQRVEGIDAIAAEVLSNGGDDNEGTTVRSIGEGIFDDLDVGSAMKGDAVDPKTLKADA